MNKKFNRLTEVKPISGQGLRIFLFLALAPSLCIAMILWVVPVHGLQADRVALAMRDFTSMWAAGGLVAEGRLQVLFDRSSFNAALQAMFGAGFPGQVWIYPPPGLLLAVPFAVFPMGLSFLAWIVGTAAALWHVLRAGGLSRAAAAAVLCSPAVAENALIGQNGALTAALLMGSFLLVESRPVVAGLLAGALIFKPQLAVLLPICFIASRNWRAFASASVSAGLLILASGLCFGFGTWNEFFTHTQPTLTVMLAEPWQDSPAQRIFVSPLMAIRSWGGGMAIAYGAQAVASLLCLGLAWRLWRMRGIDPALRAAITAPLALVAAPWVHTYDMVPLAVAIVLVFRCRGQRLPWLLAFAWFWPGAALLMPIPIWLEVASLLGVAWLAWMATGPALPMQTAQVSEAHGL